MYVHYATYILIKVLLQLNCYLLLLYFIIINYMKLYKNYLHSGITVTVKYSDSIS